MSEIKVFPSADASSVEFTQKEPERSWRGNLLKGSLAACSLGFVLQAIYYQSLSPSSYDHQPEMSALRNYCSLSFKDAPPLSFRLMQTILNTFETWGRFYSLVGLSQSEPFGDMQAFALDGNLDALKLAYASYSEEQVNSKMLSELLGRVLRYMDLYKRDLKEVAKWLIEKGADPNVQQRVKRNEMSMSSQGSHTTLMTAFHMLDPSLFSHFISKRASPLRSITNYSNGKPEVQTIFETMIQEMKASFDQREPLTSCQRRLLEADLCPIYKQMIETSLRVLPKSDPTHFEHDRVGVYLNLGQKICSNYFSVSDKDKANYEDEERRRAIERGAEWVAEGLGSFFNFFMKDRASKTEGTGQSEKNSEKKAPQEDQKQAEQNAKPNQDNSSLGFDPLARILNNTFVVKVANTTKAFFQGASEGLKNIYHSNLAQKGLEFAQAGAGKIVNKSQEAAGWVLGGVQSVVVNTGQLAYSATQSKLAGDVGHLVRSTVTSAGHLVSSGATGALHIAGGAIAVVGQAGGAALGALESAANSPITQSALNAAGQAAGAVGSAASFAVHAVGQVGGTALGALESAANSPITQSVLNAAGQAAGAAGSAAGAAANAVGYAVNEARDKVSGGVNSKRDGAVGKREA